MIEITQRGARKPDGSQYAVGERLELDTIPPSLVGKAVLVADEPEAEAPEAVADAPKRGRGRPPVAVN